MIYYLHYRKSVFPYLLLFGLLLLGNISWGNNGPGVRRFKNTLVFDASQFPKELRKFYPTKIYLICKEFWVTKAQSDSMGLYLRGDTIINFKRFSANFGYAINGYRLIFENKNSRDTVWRTNTAPGVQSFLFRPNSLDSVWQVDTKYRITDKAYNLRNGLLHMLAYDSTMKVVDDFVYNFNKKFVTPKKIPSDIILDAILREYQVYNSYDRDKYSVPTVWMLSIGIDDYGTIKWKNSKSDASSYVDFFKRQFRNLAGYGGDSLFKSYLLLDENATKDSIVKVLKEIAKKASSNDYFIFNFSGQSNLFTKDSINYFFPYDVKGYIYNPKNRKSGDTVNVLENLISQNTLQEYIQVIPATNQLFISEAGPSEKFKASFIRSLMQNSFAISAILNKNRVIIVPNHYGLDDFYCNNKSAGKAPINYSITSLDSSYNIFDLFNNSYDAQKIAFALKSYLFNCNGNTQADERYFDVFFEREFLQQNRDIFGEVEEQTRGVIFKSKEVTETLNSLSGKHYALVVGTDSYKGKGWAKLSNPVKDAQAVAEELKNSYGFEVQLLVDMPMDSIYNAIRGYYRIAQPNDQLVLYFAGHGDVDEALLSEGFIVCNDSKSVEDDPVRNTYIPYGKLQKILNNIPARQVLVLLDVCHGGTFDQKVFDNKKREAGFSNISNKNVLQFLKDKLPLRTRKFLSSVGSEPAFDGKAGRHSPFANLLLQILRAKAGEPDAILTLKEIYAVLETASLNETATLKISPHMADFGTVDAYSEFILVPVQKK